MQQIAESLLAIPAFIPATVCTGYLTAWFTNLHNFRQRSMVERLFWSLPLSLAISPISSVLIGKFLSLNAVVALLVAGALLWIVVILQEWIQLRRAGRTFNVGWHPLGGMALGLALAWVAIAVLSLVDIQSKQRLFMSVAMLDQGARVLWTESVLHTGVPPANPLYLYQHTVPMRNYYFWYVLCATVAKMTHLPVRGVFTASCVWAGFAFLALIGLYLKHFCETGSRLRRQFLLTVVLASVTGLDIAVVLWNLFRNHIAPPADLEAWSRDGIVSWLHTVFWAPHHLVSMTCCMFAFLLAWLSPKQTSRSLLMRATLISFAIGSAFGLSIYVTFAFFLAMIPWALWQVLLLRSWKVPAVLVAGGAFSLLLLSPYLAELIAAPTNRSSSPHQLSVGLFSFAVRQMIPPDQLQKFALVRAVAHNDAVASTNIARLVLLVPGYMLELGFFFATLLVFSVPSLRSNSRLTESQKSLLFIAWVTIPIASFIRSGILQTNDFAWRSAIFLQFPLLLLGSDLIMSWRVADCKEPTLGQGAPLPSPSPHWLRSIASIALVVGIAGTAGQALIFRFLIPIGEMNAKPSAASEARTLSQKAYISAVGYAELDAAIPREAVVQYNPSGLGTDRMSMIANMLGIDHQMVIASDTGGCGAEIGGDLSACPKLAAAVDSLYDGASSESARKTCHELGIQYLVVRVYDPIWMDKKSWVWNLRPVVADEDFRGLDCSD